MKAILIDPTERTVTEVEHTNDYRNIYKLLDITSPFDARQINEKGDTVFFDDEFLFKVEDGEPHDYFLLLGKLAFGDAIGGKGLILGSTEGESVSTKLTVEEVRDNVAWLRRRLVGWSPSSESEIDHPLLGKAFQIVGPRPIFEEVDQ